MLFRSVSRVVNSDVPPNAAIVWQEDGNEQTLVVELLHGEYDEANTTLKYKFKLLETAGGSLNDFKSSAMIPPDQTGPISLFIDSATSRDCMVNFINQSSTYMVYGNLTMEIGSTLITSPAVFAAGAVPLTPEGADGDMHTYRGGEGVQGSNGNHFDTGTTSGTYHIGWNDFGFGCSGNIELWDTTISESDGSGNILVNYHFDDPWIGSNSSHVDCSDKIKCSIQNHDDHDTLSETVTICDPSDDC